MAIDYSIYDFKKSYTVHEAALAWAETEYEPENRQKAYQAIYDELQRDVKGNYIQYRVKRDIRKNWINWESDSTDYTDWSRAEIWAEDLRHWAEARGQKPKFLFPEMRGDVTAAAVKTKVDATPELKKGKKKRANEMHELIKRVCDALKKELKRFPKDSQVYHAIKNRRKEFDTDSLIFNIDTEDKKISWRSLRGNTKDMTFDTLKNVVSDIRNNRL